MTPEQLDEIEKLARDPKSAAFHDLMARQTIPLVKALREAQEISKGRREEAFDWISAYFEAQQERDEAREERDEATEELIAASREIEQIKRERDEARAVKVGNLEWQADVPEQEFTWEDAKAYAASLGNGWRLPTVPELVAQFDYDKGKPKSEGWKREWYWSSSAYAGLTTAAWRVNFIHGLTYDSGVSGTYRVRCVRSVGGES